MSCKKNPGRKRKKSAVRQIYKSSNVKFNWNVDKTYEIEYSSASGYNSSRKIKILSIENKYLKTHDYKTGESRTFRKDRILNSVEVN